MTGVLAANIFGAKTFSITLGTTGDGRTGAGSIIGVGTINPNNTLQSISIDRINCNTLSANDLELNCSGSGASQTLFKFIYLEDGSGATRVFDSASSTFDSGSNLWTFGDGSSQVWAPGDAGEIKKVTFIF